MGHGGASARPLGRSRSTGFLYGNPFLPKQSSHRSLLQLRSNMQVASAGGGKSRWPYLLMAVLLLCVLSAGAMLLSKKWQAVEYAVIIDSGSTGELHALI